MRTLSVSDNDRSAISQIDPSNNIYLKGTVPATIDDSCQTKIVSTSKSIAIDTHMNAPNSPTYIASHTRRFSTETIGKASFTNTLMSETVESHFDPINLDNYQFHGGN